MPEKISVEVCEPKDLSKADWIIRLAMARDSYDVTMGDYRSSDELDYFADVHNPDQFYNSHIDPSNPEDGRRDPDSSYSGIRVATAFVAGKLAGWGYAANKTSGSNSFSRALKMRTIDKRYLWIREIITAKEFMQQGVGTEIESTLLLGANSQQPALIETFPREQEPFIETIIRRQGFYVTGTQKKYPFGPRAAASMQVGNESPTVGYVLKRL